MKEYVPDWLIILPRKVKGLVPLLSLTRLALKQKANPGLIAWTPGSLLNTRKRCSMISALSRCWEGGGVTTGQGWLCLIGIKMEMTMLGSLTAVVEVLVFF